MRSGSIGRRLFLRSFWLFFNCVDFVCLFVFGGVFGREEVLDVAMHLYNLTLVRGGAITSVVYGSFTGPKVHELAVSSGSSIGILRPDEYGTM